MYKKSNVLTSLNYKKTLRLEEEYNGCKNGYKVNIEKQRNANLIGCKYQRRMTKCKAKKRKLTDNFYCPVIIKKKVNENKYEKNDEDSGINNSMMQTKIMLDESIRNYEEKSAKDGLQPHCNYSNCLIINNNTSRTSIMNENSEKSKIMKYSKEDINEICINIERCRIICSMKSNAKYDENNQESYMDKSKRQVIFRRNNNNLGYFSIEIINESNIKENNKIINSTNESNNTENNKIINSTNENNIKENNKIINSINESNIKENNKIINSTNKTLITKYNNGKKDFDTKYESSFKNKKDTIEKIENIEENKYLSIKDKAQEDSKLVDDNIAENNINRQDEILPSYKHPSITGYNESSEENNKKETENIIISLRKVELTVDDDLIYKEETRNKDKNCKGDLLKNNIKKIYVNLLNDTDKNESDTDENKSDVHLKIKVQPVGFVNPAGYCFFNSVIQLLRGCCEFNDLIIKYHKSNEIENYTNKTKEKYFVKNLCYLMNILKEGNIDVINKVVKEIQTYFIESRNGDDVHKCFMTILTSINTITRKTITLENTSENNMANKSFLNHRMKNEGFIFNLFYGQMVSATFCNVCNYTIYKSFQLFKTLPLPVMKSNDVIDLKSCVDSFFKKSEVLFDETIQCQCKNGSNNIVSQIQITHAPKYLLIYLTRGSYYESEPKNNSYVKYHDSINIQTTQNDVLYHLISIIEHLGGSDGGHYYCKCNYEGDQWWLINDEQVSRVEFNGNISNKAIAFMFKRTCNPID